MNISVSQLEGTDFVCDQDTGFEAAVVVDVTGQHRFLPLQMGDLTFSDPVDASFYYWVLSDRYFITKHLEPLLAELLADAEFLRLNLEGKVEMFTRVLKLSPMNSMFHDFNSVVVTNIFIRILLKRLGIDNP